MGDRRDLDVRTAVYVVDAPGAVPRAVTPEDGQLAVPVWSPGGDALYVVGRLDGEIGHSDLYRVDVDGGEPVRVCPALDRNVMPGGPGYPGALPHVRADGRLLFCAREHGTVHVFDDTGREVIGGDDRVVHGMSVVGDVVAFTAATPTSTGEVHVAAVDGSGERRLTDLVAEALADVELYRPRRRWFASPDGLALEAWVVGDEDASSAPLLLDVHGGPHNAWGPTFDGVSFHHQLLAAAGWQVAYVNPRGSDGYGEDFYRGVVLGWGTSDTGDFLAVVDGLNADGTVDAGRVAVTGYSYGGFMTNWLTATTDRFRAAVSGGCVSNLLSMSGTDDLGPVFTTLENGGSAVEHPEALVDASPLRFVADVRTPTLLLHGLADDRCPVSQAEEWFAALRSLGVPTQLVLYPGASHTFRLLGRPSHRVDYTRRLVDWVTEHAGEPTASGSTHPRLFAGRSTQKRRATGGRRPWPSSTRRGSP
jgi:dipeptidyl aminopeptidase/acylaminoacyl peptidase